MKSLARHASFAAALGALLVLSGCFTTKSVRTERVRTDYDVAVLENSKGLEMTPQLVAELRSSAVNYLKENGITQSGEYVLKINLTPGQPEETGQWVVLRIRNVPARTYTLLAAYPGADDFYPEDFYGYYNYAFPSFARYGYYDPFDYGYGYGGGYFPPTIVPHQPRHPRDNDKHSPSDHTRWDGNRPDPDHPRPNDHKPDGDHPRTDNHQPDADRPHPRDHQPNPTNTRTWDRPRPRETDGGSSWSGRGGSGSYNPPPAPTRSEPSYSQPSAPAPAPERSSPQTQSRDERQQN